jgi:hypothetical protein
MFPRDGIGNKLENWRRQNPDVYWCYIVPLAHLITKWMDYDGSNFTVKKIVGQNMDSFIRTTKEKLRKGIWSVEYIKDQCQRQLYPGELNSITAGVEYRTYRVLSFLLEGLEQPAGGAWFITQEQTEQMGQPISAIVKSRLI